MTRNIWKVTHMDYVSLGRRIKRRRQVLRWSQAQLAAAVGLSVSFLGHIERGSRKASMNTLINLCNVLNMSPEDLLFESLHSYVTSHQLFTEEERRILLNAREILKKLEC